MEVQCPQCQSKFQLPDAVVRPNVKLRCSVCQHIFRYQEPSLASADTLANAAPQEAPSSLAESSFSGMEGGAQQTFSGGSDSGGGSLDDFSLDGPAPSLDKPPTEKKKKSKLFLSLMILLLCAVGAGGGWWYMKIYKPEAEQAVQGAGQSSNLASTDASAESASRITMHGVRQYYVKNEKVGSIFVVEGVVTNEFPVAKDLIEVEGALYDSNKAVLVSKKQWAGTTPSLFQLQVLGEEELESFLNNEIEILTKNTNVPPQGEVPFMVVFYNPPANVAEFGVRVVSAKDVKAQ